MSKHISLSEAAALIPDGAVVSVSSSSGLGCPDAMLKAIGERFDATGHPREIRYPARGQGAVRPCDTVPVGESSEAGTNSQSWCDSTIPYGPSFF